MLHLTVNAEQNIPSKKPDKGLIRLLQGFEAFVRVASLLRMLHTYAWTSASAQPEVMLVGSHCWCPPGPVPLRTSAPKVQQ